MPLEIPFRQPAQMTWRDDEAGRGPAAGRPQMTETAEGGLECWDASAFSVFEKRQLDGKTRG